MSILRHLRLPHEYGRRDLEFERRGLLPLPSSRGQRAPRRGPLDVGPQLWIDQDGWFYQSRKLFAAERPTATLYERAGDVLDVVEAARLGRRLWQSMDDDERDAALSRVFEPLRATFRGQPGRKAVPQPIDSLHP